MQSFIANIQKYNWFVFRDCSIHFLVLTVFLVNSLRLFLNMTMAPVNWEREFFSPICLFLLIFLHWLEPTVQDWTEVMKVDILVLFLLLGENGSVCYHWIMSAIGSLESLWSDWGSTLLFSKQFTKCFGFF